MSETRGRYFVSPITPFWVECEGQVTKAALDILCPLTTPSPVYSLTLPLDTISDWLRHLANEVQTGRMGLAVATLDTEASTLQLTLTYREE